MGCKLCSSENQSTFSVEASLARTGLDILKSDPVYVAQKAMVCLDCGFLELVISKVALESLKGTSKRASDPNSPGQG